MACVDTHPYRVHTRPPPSALMVTDEAMRCLTFLTMNKSNDTTKMASSVKPMLPEENFADLHFKSSIGIQITSPMVLGLVEYVNFDYKQTWAEKRAIKLIWKLKTRRANLNKFIVTMLMIPTVALILGLVLGLAMIVRSELTGIMLGIVGSQLMILAYYFWTSRFECDANFIRAKRIGAIRSPL